MNTKKKNDPMVIEDDIYEVYKDRLAAMGQNKDSRARNYWPILVMRRDFANQMQQKTCKEYMARNFSNLYHTEHTYEEKI